MSAHGACGCLLADVRAAACPVSFTSTAPYPYRFSTLTTLRSSLGVAGRERARRRHSSPGCRHWSRRSSRSPFKAPAASIVPPPEYLRTVCANMLRPVRRAADRRRGRSPASAAPDDGSASNTTASSPTSCSLPRALRAATSRSAASACPTPSRDVINGVPPAKRWMHAYTYSGHPTCCAVAL